MSGTKERLGVGIIGCGLIGQKRAKALPAADELIACADVSLDRAQALARSFGATAVTDWRIVTDDPAIDVVIIATPHDTLAEITLAAVDAGKHVLVEKPAARFASELEPGPCRPGQKAACRFMWGSIIDTTDPCARRKNSSPPEFSAS